MSQQGERPPFGGDARGWSVYLAKARGLGSCFVRTMLVKSTRDERTRALLTATYHVESATNPYALFIVRYDALRDDATCGCRAGVGGHACWHRGVVLLKAREFGTAR